MTSLKTDPLVRVLVVDDSETASRITRRYLAAMRTPSSVEWIADASAAIEALCENRHDVCLLDLHLEGGVTGFEVLRTARSAGCAVPTIILTSDSAHEADVGASEAGAVDFLVKGELTTTLIDRAVRYAHASGARQKQSDEGRRLSEEIRELRAQKVIDDALRVAEVAVRESEARFRAMADCSPVGIFMADVEGNCLYANPELQRQMGGGSHLALGRKWLDAVHPDDRDALKTAVNDAVRESRSYALPSRYLRSDGVTTWTALSGEPIRDGDKVLGYVGTSLDVTAQREAETALRAVEEQLRHSQRMDAVGQLAAGVAHDFNNLLLVIDCCTEFLAEDVINTTSPGYEDLAEIRRASARAAALTRQLLAFSRRQVLRPCALDANAVVTDTEPMLRRLIGEDIAIVMDLAPALSTVRADAGQFEQILVNLVVNARDAMPTGGTISVATRHIVVDDDLAREHRIMPGGYVALSVRDTGLGIPPAVLGRIFEPFFTTKGPGQGTGLGLSTVYGVVHQSGGFIRVESEEGRGSVFEIALPREAASTAPPAAVVVPAIAARGRERILLVEDEPAVRALTTRILERQGYEVVAARDGAEALRIADREGLFDALVTDMVMPGMNGRELYERLRAQCATIAVVYMSGYTDDEIFRRGILAGSIEFVSKPFTSLQLAAAVRSALGDPALLDPPVAFEGLDVRA